MNQMPAVVGELVTRWRKDAVAREPLGSARAEVYRSCAAQLESTLSALTAEAGKGEELEALIEAAIENSGGHWIDSQFRIDATDLMAMLRRLALSTATPAGEWRPTFGREPEGWRNHRLMFVCWEGGAVEASECYGSIAWEETTHWMPATKPASPRGASESK
jgi:hypothetical protein